VNDTSFTDGHSLLPLLTGKAFTPRKHVVVHYDPIWSNNVNKHRNRFIRNQEYKWYQDDRFYNVMTDAEEQYSFADSLLSPEELKLKNGFTQIESRHPKWK